MPASVAAANPTVVLPYSLAIAYQQTRVRLAEENRYRGGEVQRTALVATSRKSWTIAKRLTTAELAALETFRNTVGLHEFWFYDIWETVPRLSESGYDLTGSVTAGRYTVTFDGAWQTTIGLGRHEAAFALIEVA